MRLFTLSIVMVLAGCASPAQKVADSAPVVTDTGSVQAYVAGGNVLQYCSRHASDPQKQMELQMKRCFSKRLAGRFPFYYFILLVAASTDLRCHYNKSLDSRAAFPRKSHSTRLGLVRIIKHTDLMTVNEL